MIYTTHLSDGAADLYALDLTESSGAHCFGNETLALVTYHPPLSDGDFIIPQVPLPSLNISVACAVTFTKHSGKRMRKGHYLHLHVCLNPLST